MTNTWEGFNKKHIRTYTADGLKKVWRTQTHTDLSCRELISGKLMLYLKQITHERPNKKEKTLTSTNSKDTAFVLVTEITIQNHQSAASKCLKCKEALPEMDIHRF